MVKEEDSDDEQTLFAPLPDGKTLCTHGNGTNQIRLVDAEPSDEAYVYDIPPEKIFVRGQPLSLDLGRHNWVGSCKFVIGSQCGRSFDQYFREVIKEPTAYSANGGQEKDMPMLWPNRRLKIKFSKDCLSWAEGKVVKFKNMCTGPYSPCTRWFVEIELLGEDKGCDIKPGQLVEMFGLKAAKQYNKTYGVLTKEENKDGRCTIVIRSGKLLCIKPQNFRGVRILSKEVYRMNVSGGGVLKGESLDVADKISFEWIDKADPEWEPKIDGLEEDEERSIRTFERINDLTNAYIKMGLISKALQSNQEACSYGDRSKLPHVYEEQDRLTKEMKRWTGTSDSFLSEEGLRITLEKVSGQSDTDIQHETDPGMIMLRPHTQVPPHFGAMDDAEYWDPVPVGLPRPLALRSLPSSVSNFDSNEAKDIFMSIYDGRFRLKWEAGTGADLLRGGVALPQGFPTDSSCQFLLLFACTPDSGAEIVMSTYVMLMQMPMINQMITTKFLDTKEPYKSMFTVDQKNVLCLRIIHWSARLLGAKIDRSFEVYHLCNFLKQEYPKFSNWKDAVDASVIQTDFIHKNGKPSDFLFAGLNGVGEAMEAAKMFDGAAKVYADSANFFVSKGIFSKAAQLFQNGGLAYRRCLSFENAESLYVTSLHYHLKSKGDKLNVNDSSFDNIITNMFVNYDMWLNESNGGTQRTKTMHTVFCCLLYRSGFQARQGGRIGFAVHTHGKQMSTFALNDQCRTAKQCNQALKNAMMAARVVSMFHNKIMECKSIVLHSASFTPDSNNGISTTRSDEKAAARETVMSGFGRGFSEDLVRCCNVSCGRVMAADEIKYCACKKVTYCSKDCQRADWKIHKKMCSTKQAKK